MMKLLPSTAACIAALLAPLAAHAQTAGSPSAQDIDKGRQLFMSNGCFSCHGTQGQGGERSAAPRIAPDPYPFAAFKILVRSPREAMPRFDERFLDDAQLLSIHHYLNAVPKGRAAKDIPQLQLEDR